MTTDWKKRYSFRLTEEDAHISTYLESLPKNRRSEAIRQLLGIAVRYMNVEQNQQKAFQDLMNELKYMQDKQAQQFETLRGQLEKGGTFQSEEQVEKEQTSDMSDQAINDTANAFLSSFGMSFDD
ncbi:hypothetical protein [Virgibacillus ainsalahensis]